MSYAFFALFFGLGVGGWVYSQASQRMSGNPKAVWGSTVAAAAVAFFIFYSLFAWVIG